MLKNFLAIMMAVVLLLITLTACGSDSLNGTWYCCCGYDIVEFSGRKFTFSCCCGEYVETGTFSVTDNQIEFVIDDDIWVESFSRTENTIRIDGERFTRR
jgi:hypothetical protein